MEQESQQESQQEMEQKNENDANLGELPIKNVDMGSILTEKIPWLIRDPRTISTKTKKEYLYIK